MFITELSGPAAAIDGNIDYVPSFNAPQLFRWQGHWVEITKVATHEIENSCASSSSCQSLEIAHIFQTDRDVHSIYTREMMVLSALVEEARQRYNETSKQYLTIYSVDFDGLNLSPLHISLYHTTLVRLRIKTTVE